ncbi:hypothetical protein ABPG74_014384 [Tetrahymena malaccensis]
MIQQLNKTQFNKQIKYYFINYLNFIQKLSNFILKGYLFFTFPQYFQSFYLIKKIVSFKNQTIMVILQNTFILINSIFFVYLFYIIYQCQSLQKAYQKFMFQSIILVKLDCFLLGYQIEFISIIDYFLNTLKELTLYCQIRFLIFNQQKSQLFYNNFSSSTLSLSIEYLPNIKAIICLLKFIPNYNKNLIQNLQKNKSYILNLSEFVIEIILFRVLYQLK